MRRIERRNNADLLLRIRQDEKSKNDTDLLLRVRQDKMSRVKNDAEKIRSVQGSDADMLLKVR